MCFNVVTFVLYFFALWLHVFYRCVVDTYYTDTYYFTNIHTVNVAGDNYKFTILFYSGGDSNAGTIIELSTWESKSFRGAVKVLWNDGPDRFVKHYRVGAEGCVDVIFGRMIENSNGGTYYADHLPLVSKKSKIKINLTLFCI